MPVDQLEQIGIGYLGPVQGRALGEDQRDQSAVENDLRIGSPQGHRPVSRAG